MPRRSRPSENPEKLRDELVTLLNNFSSLRTSELRIRVLALVPAFHKLRDLGSSMMPIGTPENAKDRVLAYFQLYPQKVIHGDELMVISGIGEWSRRLRELRKQDGWWIYSGNTFADIREAAKAARDTLELAEIEVLDIRPEQYVLTRNEQDREAAHRWHILNGIRKREGSVTTKILEYLRANAGKEVTGEELRYLARDKSEWARRVRELRTEAGWPIATKSSGLPELRIGVYVLERDQQSEEHDRHIPDPIRVKVLVRDNFSCVECGWNRSMVSPEDPRRFLELHHLAQHKNKGQNTVENLITLCNVHHDGRHRS